MFWFLRQKMRWQHFLKKNKSGMRWCLVFYGWLINSAANGGGGYNRKAILTPAIKLVILKIF